MHPTQTRRKTMKYINTRKCTLVFATAACLLCLTIAQAKKPNNTGGGGGDKGPSYNIFHLTDELLDENDNLIAVFTNGHARGINDTGVVVGQVEDSNTGAYLAACWTITKSDGSIESTLHLLPGGGTARSINNSGEAVGSGEDGFGIYWNTVNGTQIVLPPLVGDDRSSAWSINEDSVVCGISTHASGADTGVVWRINSGQVSGPVALPTLTESFALSLNDNDENGIAEVVGGYRYDPVTETPETAIVWIIQSNIDGTLQVNTTVPLDTNAAASGVNNLGAVCGDVLQEAVVWSGGSKTILKGNKFLFTPTAENLNDGGAIVGSAIYQKGFDGPGYRAVLWPSAGSSVILLDKFLNADSPFHHLSGANAVNESGEIVGIGGDGLIDFQGAFLAVPK
jgi:hypothetical protein